MTATPTTLLTCDICAFTLSLNDPGIHTARAKARVVGWRLIKSADRKRIDVCPGCHRGFDGGWQS
jgi:hypothetical protein